MRELISSTGLSTSEPAVNFLAATLRPDDGIYHVNEKEMAVRVSRAFLGVRIDCAECHNHPFEPWKQTDFQSLAAFFREACAKIRRNSRRERRISGRRPRHRQAADH